jgi:hypothetical protein
MNQLDAIALFLTDLLVFFVNGVLVIVYALIDNGAAVASVASAGLMAAIPDAEVQKRAGFRPRRFDRPGTAGEGRTAQVMTGMVLVLWLIAQWGMGAPVPWLGAAMWAAGLLGILAMPGQRFNLLWYVKGGIAMYALAVLGSRLYLASTSQLTAEEWAALIGSRESAAAVIAGAQGSVTTIVLWALWLVIPLGYFSMLVQHVFANPMSLINPLQGAQDLVRHLRSQDGR